jgi:hypothetical protein
VVENSLSVFGTLVTDADTYGVRDELAKSLGIPFSHQSSRMNRFLFVGAGFVAFAIMGVTRVQDIDKRLGQIDQFTSNLPQREQARDMEMEGLRSKISALLTELGQTRDTANQANQAFEARVMDLEESLSAAYITLEGVTSNEAQSEVLESMRVETTEALAELRMVGERRWSDVSYTVAAVNDRAESALSTLDRLSREITADDAQERWEAIVAPTVQLAGTSTVGSGVLMESTPNEDGEGHQTLMLTSWHVVRDIRADSLAANPPIPVEIHMGDGEVRYESATLIDFDVKLDSALLVLDSTEPVKHGARLSSRKYLESRKVFHRIYAVGCPLGNDPIPTAGEIADLDHDIDGQDYWMISAPTYIGNSGGGIYDTGTRRLMGLFSKIYTHGNLRPSVVTHMGLVTPLGPVYDWLDEAGKACVTSVGDGEVRIELVKATAEAMSEPMLDFDHGFETPVPPATLDGK